MAIAAFEHIHAQQCPIIDPIVDMNRDLTARMWAAMVRCTWHGGRALRCCVAAGRVLRFAVCWRLYHGSMSVCGAVGYRTRLNQ